MKDFLNSIHKKLSLKHTFFDELKILRALDAIELSNKKSKKIIIYTQKKNIEFIKELKN